MKVRYNSPWNIAVKFDVDMSFNGYEIGTMLSEYANENNNDLYQYIYNILVLNINVIFNINNPVIELGYMLGYLVCGEDNNVQVSNQIIKEVIYNYMDIKN